MSRTRTRGRCGMKTDAEVVAVAMVEGEGGVGAVRVSIGKRATKAAEVEKRLSSTATKEGKKGRRELVKRNLNADEGRGLTGLVIRVRVSRRSFERKHRVSR
ncbi:hypothetical protein Droror1_Dr00024236 [Drosera rotundifolia]